MNKLLEIKNLFDSRFKSCIISRKIKEIIHFTEGNRGFMYDSIIVGAGIAGATVARRLAEKSDKKVLVIERRNHIGGNCYDKFDDY